MKKTTIAAGTLAVALGLSACGSSGGDSGSKAASSASSSSSSSSAAPVAKVGDTVDISEAMSKSAEAVKAKKTGHMAMSLGSAGKMEADVDYGAASPSMSMTMDMGGQSMNIVLVDKKLYMGGDMFAAMAGGKKWVKADPNGTDPLSQQLKPMFEQMDQMVANPAQQFAGMKGVKGTVTKADASGTTYDIKLTKEQLAAQSGNLPGMDAETLKNLPNGLNYSITLDKESLPTLVETEVAGQKVAITMSKWGEGVKIAAPPASEIGTLQMPKS
jgi:hypothetical protein